jgi:hypothetical protein
MGFNCEEQKLEQKGAKVAKKMKREVKTYGVTKSGVSAMFRI